MKIKCPDCLMEYDAVKNLHIEPKDPLCRDVTVACKCGCKFDLHFNRPKIRRFIFFWKLGEPTMKVTKRDRA